MKCTVLLVTRGIYGGKAAVEESRGEGGKWAGA